MNNKQREKIYQWVMASGLQDALFYKVKNAEGKEVVMDRFENFEAFVWNVEQEEREACAKVVENILLAEGADVDDVLLRLAEDIRERGQA